MGGALAARYPANRLKGQPSHIAVAAALWHRPYVPVGDGVEAPVLRAN